jgi:hypothetical protein
LVGLYPYTLNQNPDGITPTSTANPWGNMPSGQVVYIVNGQQVQPVGWNTTLPAVAIGGGYTSDYFDFAREQTKYERVLTLRAFIASFTPIDEPAEREQIRARKQNFRARHGYQMAPRLPCYRGRRTR